MFCVVMYYYELCVSGSLVYGRMLDKSGVNGKPLPEDFTPEQVPESAKETCRNWFFKVASIRELIPRLYPFHAT